MTTIISVVENIMWANKDLDLAAKSGKIGSSFTKRLMELKIDRPANGAKYMISYTSESGKRYSCKTGRFIKKFFGEFFDDQGILNAGKEINADLWAAAADVELLTGEDIRDFYLKENSGISSCMAHEECQEYLDLYVYNPEVIKLATFKSGERHAARALVWNIDGTRYMDKIYYTSDLSVQALKSWRKENQVLDYYDLRDSKPAVHLSLNPNIDITKHYFPYMDSFCYMNIIDEKHIELKTEDGDYYLDSTAGGPGVRRCAECSSLGVKIRYHKQTAYCCECYDKKFTRCSRCCVDLPKSTIKEHNSFPYCPSCIKKVEETPETVDQATYKGSRSVALPLDWDWYIPVRPLGFRD